MNRLSVLIVAVLVAVMAFGVVGSAAAQGPDDNGQPGNGPDDPNGPRDFGDRGRGNFFNGERGRGGFGFNFAMQVDDAVVADALGITADELQAFYDQGMNIREIARELNVNLDNVQAAIREVAQAERDAAIAAAFGITLDELQAYYDQDMGIREIAQELNVNLDNVIETLTAEARAEAQAQLADALGIPVEDLQAMLEDGMNLREIIEELGIDVESLELPRGFGFDNFRDRGQRNDRNDRGNRGGFPGGNNNTPADDAPPASTDPSA